MHIDSITRRQQVARRSDMDPQPQGLAAGIEPGQGVGRHNHSPAAID